MQHLGSFLLNQQFHWAKENRLLYIDHVYCHVTVTVVCVVIALLWIAMWSVIVAFPDNTHML